MKYRLVQTGKCYLLSLSHHVCVYVFLMSWVEVNMCQGVWGVSEDNLWEWVLSFVLTQVPWWSPGQQACEVSDLIHPALSQAPFFP